MASVAAVTVGDFPPDAGIEGEWCVVCGDTDGWVWAWRVLEEEGDEGKAAEEGTESDEEGGTDNGGKGVGLVARLLWRRRRRGAGAGVAQCVVYYAGTVLAGSSTGYVTIYDAPTGSVVP
eukprot:3192068-Rhodomonas_salina.1